jgi:hypothetical protein
MAQPGTGGTGPQMHRGKGEEAEGGAWASALRSDHKGASLCDCKHCPVPQVAMTPENNFRKLSATSYRPPILPQAK